MRQSNVNFRFNSDNPTLNNSNQVVKGLKSKLKTIYPWIQSKEVNIFL